MDWAKLDAALADALDGDDDGRRYAVFVHLAPGADVAPGAAGLGVAAGGEGPVRTATVTKADIGRLSHHDAVTQLRLSRRLGLADEA